MRRTISPNKARRKHNQREGTSTTAEPEPDPLHNSSSPSCYRLQQIVRQQLALTAAPVAGTEPAAGFAALVRKYLLEVRQSPEGNAAAAGKTSKKKRKKKKKKKGGAGAAGAAATDEEESILPVDSTGPTPAEAAALLGAQNNQEGDAVAESDPTSRTLNGDHPSVAELDPKKAWINRRYERRRTWVDRFLDHCRMQQQQQEKSNTSDVLAVGKQPTTADEITDQIDKFLTWLSKTNSNASSPASNNGATATNSSNAASRKGRGDGDSQSSTAQNGISVFKGAEAEQAINSIQCLDCRNIIGRRLRNSVVLSGNLEIDEPTKDFQYVSMEEGNGRAVPPHTLALTVPENSSLAWRLERLDGAPFVWTRDAFEFWLLEYVILGGLGYDEVVVEPYHSFTEDELVAVKAELGRISTISATEFKDTAAIMEKQLKKLNSIQHSGENIDMKSPHVMLDVDSELSVVTERLLRTALEITHTYQRVSLFLTRAAARTGRPQPVISSYLLDDLAAGSVPLETFLEGIQKVFELMSSYERKFFALQDESGSIPPLFFIRDVRKVFEDFLRDRAKSMYDFTTMLYSLVDGDPTDIVETVATVFLPVFTRMLRAVDELLKKVVPHYPVRKTPLDEACEDVLYLLNEWTHFERQQKIEKIMEQHENRRLKLVEALDRADQLLHMAITNIGDEHPDAKTLENFYSDWRNCDLSRVTIQDLASLDSARTLALSKVHALGRLWLRLGANRSVEPDTFPSKMPCMPLELVEHVTLGTPNETRLCKDGCECRAGCLLSALLFEWMSQRYDEWQAEIAGQELLTTVGLGVDTGTSWSEVAKGGKKAARKKEKKAAALTKPVEAHVGKVQSESTAPDVGRDDYVEETDVSKLPNHDGADGEKKSAAKVAAADMQSKDEEANLEIHVNSNNTAKPAVDQGALKTEPTSQAVDVKRSVDSGVQEQPQSDTKLIGESAHLEKPENEATDSATDPGSATPLAQITSGDRGFETSTRPLSLAEIDAMIGMKVFDRSGSQAAEAFLLDRYNQVIEKGKAGKAKVFEIF